MKQPGDEKVVPTKPAEHISQAACAVLFSRVATKEQISQALSAVDDATHRPIVVAPEKVESKEPRTSAIKFYEQISKTGSAETILLLAELSSYFKEHYQNAIKWAEKQKILKSQSPIKT